MTRDPDDDYVVALATGEGAEAIVIGDGDLQALDIQPPVVTPRAFLGRLQATDK